jgi:hypothetical protein
MENKETISISSDPIWQKGYESALKDLRQAIPTMYNSNNKDAIRQVLMYVFRKVDFDNLHDWKTFFIWTGKNLD